MSKKKKSHKNKTPQSAPTSAPKTTASKNKKLNLEGSFWVNHQLHLLLIFFISSLLYANTLYHQYAVDDSIVILRNKFTKKGWAGMPGIWGEDTFTGFFGSKRNLVAGGRYRPLSLATFAMELQLFGDPIVDKDGQYILDADGDINYHGEPFISHAVNLLLYAWLCMVIYLMLLQMFNPKREKDKLKGYFIALAGALLYATHPIHTEAVANIKGRDEIMVLLGSVLAVYWVLRAAVSNNKVLYHAAAIGAFVFALFSKENAITFLAIIPAALYFFTKQDLPKIALQTAPYLVIVVAFWFGVRAPILGEAAAVVGSENAPATELMNDPFLKIEGNRYVSFTASERIATVLYTWIEYIKLLIYPHPLTNDYYPKHIRTDQDIIPSFQMAKVLLSVLVHLALGLFLLLGTLKKKPYAFFILFYLATFSVVSNLIFPIGTNMAERFMFLPSVGFSVLCAMGLYHLVQQRLQKEGDWQKALKTPVVILTVLCVLYGGKTFSRNFAWYDDYTLFTTDIHNSPYSAKLNNAVSGVLQDKANKTADRNQRKQLITEALQKSIIATQLHPTYNNAWLLRGNANVMLGGICQQEGAQSQNAASKTTLFKQALAYYDAGIQAYNEVMRLRPDHPDVKRNFGVVYRDRGKLLGQYLGQLDASLASIEKSLTYSKKDFESFRLLGVAYGMKGMQFQQAGRHEEGVALHYKAISYFEKAIEMNPNSVPILYNLEIAYRQLNVVEKVAEYNQRWKAIDPNYDPSKQQ